MIILLLFSNMYATIGTILYFSNESEALQDKVIRQKMIELFKRGA